MAEHEKRERERLAREATRIFMLVEGDPTSTAALQSKEAFLARGAAEREAWARTERVWSAVRQKRRPGGGSLALIFGLCLGGAVAGSFGYEPIRLALLADLRTEHAPLRATLASGDAVHLDAGSAIADDSDGGMRSVRLLAGAAFFDVAPGQSRFLVSAGDVTVEVVGTAFEVAEFGDALSVGVVEGRVAVRAGSTAVELGPGERLRVGAAGIEDAEPIDAAAVATWREDRLITDGMTVAEVVDVLDRRLPGRIVVLSRSLGDREVTGGLDLSDPLQALKALAAVRNAEVINTVPGLAVLVAGDE